MARGKPLGFVNYIIMPDGRTIPFSDLTEAERAELKQRQQQRLSENMSAYYTQHPEEFAAL